MKIEHQGIDFKLLDDVGGKVIEMSSKDVDDEIRKPTGSAELFSELRKNLQNDLDAMIDLQKAKISELEARLSQMESLRAAMDDQPKKSMTLLGRAGDKYLVAATQVRSFMDKISPSRNIAAATKFFGLTVERFKKKGNDVAEKLDQAGNAIVREVRAVSASFVETKTAIKGAATVMGEVAAEDFRAVKSSIVSGVASAKDAALNEILETKRVMSEMKTEALDDVARAKIVAGNALAVTSNLFGSIGAVVSKMVNHAITSTSDQVTNAAIAVQKIVDERDTERFRSIMVDISGGAEPLDRIADLERLCRISGRYVENRFDIGDGKKGNLLEALYARTLNAEHPETLERFEAISQVLINAGARMGADYLRENLEPVRALRSRIEQNSANDVSKDGFSPAKAQNQFSPA